MNNHNSKNSLKFAFLGDLFLGGELIPYSEKHHFDLLKPFQLVSNYLSEVDIFFVNFEGPICSGQNKREDVTVTLSNHPSIIEFLKKFKICVLNLANNHMMDYGSEGLDKTLMLLDANKLHHIGADCNDAEADKELIVECKDRKIAFIAYTTDELHVRSVIARNDKPGCAAYLDLDKVVRKIHDLKNRADVICVSLHWGHEYYQYPSSLQVNIAHTFADAGADYVIGHHPHVIQGMENYKNSLIMYSLGNFLFSPVRSTNGRLLYRKPLTNEFMIVRSAFSESEIIGYDLLGGTINKNYCLIPFVGTELKRFIQNVESLSCPINNSNYNKFWVKYQAKRKKELLNEDLIDAFRKLSRMSFRDLLTTIKKDDIKRNIQRVYKVLFKSL